MKRYSKQSEVRFKVTDQQAEIFRDTAWYLYESHMLDKPNIQSFGRWCMNYVSRLYGGGVIQSKVIRQQKIQRQILQQQPQHVQPYNNSDSVYPYSFHQP
jgi:hypothetical protein